MDRENQLIVSSQEVDSRIATIVNEVAKGRSSRNQSSIELLDDGRAVVDQHFARAILKEVELQLSNRSRFYRQSWFVGLVATLSTLVIAAVFALYVWPQPPSLGEISATIVLPSEDRPVGSRIVASGSVQNLPDGMELQLVIRRGHYIWPKAEKPVIHNGNWEATIHEYGADGELVLALLGIPADGTAREKVDKWLDDANTRQIYLPLREIPGSLNLDSVLLTMEKDP